MSDSFDFSDIKNGKDLDLKAIEMFKNRVPMADLMRFRSEAMDHLIQYYFNRQEQPVSPDDYCFIASGSYGRYEMQHRSDCELAILHNGIPLETLDQMDKSFLHPLIKSTRKISVMNRNVSKEFKDYDLNLPEKTATFEGRIVFGNPKIFKKWRGLLEKYWKHPYNVESYVSEQFSDMDEKLTKERAEDTIFFKEGYGGLRLWHYLIWISNALKIDWKSQMHPSEVRLVEAHCQLMFYLRDLSHMQTNKCIDEISFSDYDTIFKNFPGLAPERTLVEKSSHKYSDVLLRTLNNLRS